MEQPTINLVTAALTVDYLGHAHSWSETEVTSTYSQICKELAEFRGRRRDEHDKPEYQNLVKLHNEIEAKKAQKQQHKRSSSVPASPNKKSGGLPKKVKDPLKKQEREEWLQEKRLLRQKNALWRRMGVVKSGKLVEPRSLNWQKECDVLWLFGPLYQPEESYSTSDEADWPPVVTSVTTPSYATPNYATPNYASPIKPALKKPVEHSPIDDLLTYYTCSMILNKDNDKPIDHYYDSEYSDSDTTDAYDSDSGNSSDSSCASHHSSSGQRRTLPRLRMANGGQSPKKKKSLRFSPKLEQIHYTPTQYSAKPPSPQSRRRSPPQRLNSNTKKNLDCYFDSEKDEHKKKLANNFGSELGLAPNKEFTTSGVAIGIKGVGMMDDCKNYDQIFNWAKSQVKTSGTFSLFCDDSKSEKSTVDAKPVKTHVPSKNNVTLPGGAAEYEKMLAAAKAASTAPRKRVYPQYSKPVYDAELLSDDEFSCDSDELEMLGNVAKEVITVAEARYGLADEESSDGSLVSKCVNMAENAKDVVSWFGAMIWDGSLM